ncbi:gliding motility-associated-like protein [Chitinophaga niastensis]|uniref:Gliding motility-associated-like protein n=1 Tax=Chitinophaga niastensis TaxID=536980 RepID=A0A2P8H9N9_CHINA|nr:MBG domain-containing protein [Chitinophaga niastensis]PSL42900.1 gliding motility-associated-like protein [Chitinophaga niastensis]
MKLTLLRTVISLLLLTSISQCVQAQAIGAGDLVFTGINIFDDNTNGVTQNDVFSFVMLRDCPANTLINFTDLGWTGSGFQSLSCAAGTGSQTDGVITWSSGNTVIRAGQQVLIFCKYGPTASIGYIQTGTPTVSTASAGTKAYISLGLAGDQLFAFTGNINSPTLIAGINVNRNFWDLSLGSCDFTSSQSVMPATTAVLNFPSINAVNARYLCDIQIGSSDQLRKHLQNTTYWGMDNTLSSIIPISYDLKKALPCNLTIVNPDASGIVYVNNQSATPGDGHNWTSPLPELRDALIAAADPLNSITQIWVAKGVYKPTANLNPNFTFSIPFNVAVYGGFAGNELTVAARNIAANPVILSGDLQGNDVNTAGVVIKASDIAGTNSYTLVKFINTGPLTLLDGVIITGGASPFQGGGIYSSNGNAKITNTRFYGNSAPSSGGAASFNGLGTIELTNCTFFGNRSGLQGGAIFQSNSTLKLTNVTISGNNAATEGAGVATTGGTFTAYNSIISGNTSANSSKDTYFSGTTTGINYTILSDQYYTSSGSQQSTLPVQFTNSNTGDLRLTPGNFAINKGDPQTNNTGYAAQAGTSDLAGQPRISNTVIDLGAFELQAQSQTITFPAFSTAIYGDVNIDPQATTTGDATITYTSGNTAVAQVIGNKIKAVGVGTAVVTANAAATSSYLAATPVTRTITVNKKALLVTANDVSRPYSTANPAATFTYSGFVNSEDASVITGTINATYGGNAGSPAGTYAITTDVSGASAANYSLSGANGTLTITPQPQTITFTAPTNVTYGAAPLTLPLNTDAGVAIVYNVVSGPATVSGNTLTITGAGDVTITANQPGDGNHAAAAQVSQTFTVAKAVLIVAGNDKSKPYKQPNPVLDYTITGFVNGDNSSVVSNIPDISTTADINSNVGAYPILVSIGTLSAANYSFSFTNGNLIVVKAAQTITFPNLTTKAYGSAPFDPGATSDGGLPITYSIIGPATISGNILTITGAGSITVTAQQSGDPNYNAATPVLRGFSVTKAMLIIKPDDKQRLFGQNNPVLTYTYSGLVNGEDNSVVIGTPTLSTTADINSMPGNYPITITNLGSLSAANYTLLPANGSLSVLTAPQTINFPIVSDKTYGDAPVTLNANSSSGLPVTYNVTSGPATISGNTLTFTGTGSVTITADQAGDGGHTPAPQATQTFNVNKATLTVTANNKTKAYLQANPALDYTITGFVNADNSSVVSGTATINTTAVSNSAPGTYPITVSAGNLSAANYLFSFVNGSINITQATQTITFAPLSGKTYGNAPVTLNATSDAGLPVTYTVTSGPATISGNTLTITGTGNVTVTATQPGDANYNAATPVSNSFLVAPATLTVKADDQQKVYGANNPALTYTITGFVNSDNSSVVSGTPVLNTIADNSSVVGNYPITVTTGTLNAANYTFTTANGTLTVGLAAQTITFPAISNKTYGDAAFALNATSSSALPVTYSVVSGPATISGNTVTITGTGSVTIAADQAGNSNYSAAPQSTQTFSINKATLTITANNKTKAYLQANPTLDYTITGFVNADNSSVVSGTATINTTAVSNSAPGTYPITVSAGNLSAANYSFSFVNGSISITQAAQTITFAPLSGKTYGNAPVTLNATSDAGLPVTYTVTSGPATISGNTLTITGAGNLTVTATQPGDANYNAATPVSNSFLVAPATLTVKADDLQKIYGANNPALTYTITGFVNSDNSSVVSGTPVLNTIANNSSIVGNYPITVTTGTLNAANYTFTTANGTLTVGLAAQTITFPAISNKTYGDAAFALNATSNSALPVTYSVVSGPATISGNTVTITGTGSVTIAADQAGNSNHSAAPQSTQTFSVNKATLTVTANNKTKVYLQANPTLDYTIIGFVNADNNSVVSGTATINTTAAINSAPGTYPITVSAGNLSAANYSFSFVNGSISITQAVQTITFAPLSGKTYGNAPFALNATSDAGLPVTYTVTSGPATISGNTLTITGAGNVTVTATQPGDANYNAATPVSNAFLVAPATLTVKADDLQKIYGANNPALTYTITGFVNSDNSSVVSGTPVLNTIANNSSIVGNYPITVTTGTLNAANYTFTTVNGTLTVALTAQTITFPAISNKTYGDAAFALNATSNSGLPVTYSVVSGPATISGNTVTITGAGSVTIAADQAGNSNYSAAPQSTQTFSVNKATLTVTANNKTKVYLQANPTLDYTITGFVNADNSSVVSGTAAINTTAVSNSVPAIYPITVSAGNLNAANYSFSFVNGSISITQAAQTITFAPLSGKTYGNAPFTLNATSDAGLPITYTVTSGPATISGNTLTITGAGNVTVTATQPGDANYNAATPVSNAFLVAPATLTVKADDQQKIYGTNNPALTYTITGFVNSDNSSVVSGTPVLNTIANNSSGVGSYPITVTVNTLNAANYTFTTVNGTLTVALTAQTITFPAISNKTYGDAAFALNATSSSALPVTYSVVSGPATISGNTVTITGAGSITIAANQPGNSNYSAATQATQTFSVNKTTLTVKAKNDTRTYTGTAYTGGNGADFNGFVNGDDATKLNGSITYTGNSQGAVNAGIYIITPAGLTSSNYIITYADGQLNIARATQQIIFSAIGNKNQGDPDFMLTATSNSGLPVTFTTDNTQVISLNGNTAHIGVAGTVHISVSQAGDNNYEPAQTVIQTIQVTAWSAPVITAQGNLIICEGNTVTLQSTTAPAYEWYRNNILIPGAASGSLTVTESGSYTVKAIYNNNFSISSAAVSVTVNPLPVGNVQVNGNTTISKGETVRLIASGGNTYAWDPAAGVSDPATATTMARPATTTTYQVTITSIAGCSVTKEITITVKEDYKLEATNILTPNGDGKNDLWIVKNIDMYPQNEVKVFDRSGRMIYHQRSYNNNWNGTVNGHPLAEGTYYYIIDLGNNKPQFKGFITVIREN